MRRLILIVCASLFASFLCFACGGGSGGGGVGSLQGTWLGWIEDDEGNIEEFSLQLDGAGDVVDVKIGGVSTGNTGHVNEDWDENLFHVLYDGGSPLSRGYMIVDDQYSHATYGDNGSSGNSHYYCGVLEKGAMSYPAYASSDIVASYPVGGAYVYTFDSGSWNWVGDAISMTVNPALAFTGTAPDGPFSGSFHLYDSDYGLYAGDLTSTAMTMDITAFVSPDGTAVAAFARDTNITPTSLDDFVLIGLKK